MHETAQEILYLFKKTGSEMSTSEILKNINEEYKLLKDRNSEEEKEKLARWHRRTLHHLNKLVDYGILAVTKHGEKGEKFYELSLGEGEEIIEMAPMYRKKMIISKPNLPILPIEGYEQKGIIQRYEPATWMDRLNSLVVFADKIEKENMLSFLVEKVFPVVNDAVYLENFEVFLNEDYVDFLKDVSAECEDYGKILNLGINFSNIKEGNGFKKLIEILEKEKLDKINFIFCLDRETISKKEKELILILDSFIKSKKLFFVRNKEIGQSPYFVGRAGPYCFVEKEWNLAEDVWKNCVCLGCAQTTAIVDVDRFQNEYGADIEKFSQVMFNLSKSILNANSFQRRKSDEYFRGINSLNKGNEREFLTLSRNYIRFWNFGLNEPEKNPEFVLTMINEAKKKIEEFASAEETIYKSCGMTTRFKIALSSAFASATKLSSPKYNKLEISSSEDLHKKEVKKVILDRISCLQIFVGGDEVTFHYVGELNAKTILEQIGEIMSNYKIPFLNYSLEGVRGNLKITNFI